MFLRKTSVVRVPISLTFVRVPTSLSYNNTETSATGTRTQVARAKTDTKAGCCREEGAVEKGVLSGRECPRERGVVGKGCCRGGGVVGKGALSGQDSGGVCFDSPGRTQKTN